MARYKKPKHLIRDFFFVFVSIVIGYLIYINHINISFDSHDPVVGILTSFIAGLFFTSAFTITPAGVVLAELMQSFPAVEVAFFGSIGALIGDLIIFTFIRDSLSDDLTYLLRIAGPKRFIHLFKFPFIRFITPLIGALLIASPLPDELGLAMMGFSKTRTSILVPICFGMNFLGIILIAVAIHAI